MVLMQQGPVECNECLPLLVVEFRPSLRGLRTVDLDALGFNHHQPGIDPFDFSYQLLLGDRTSLWLPYYFIHTGVLFFGLNRL